MTVTSLYNRPYGTCSKHGTDFISGGVDENDIGFVFCLLCSEAELSPRGRLRLAQRRQALMDAQREAL